jgi:NAD(P)-dependent dehydrogenase (short-subunit alcohol dehydrogenase family)
VTDTFGGLNYAFNNAGVMTPPVPLTQLTEADFDYMVGINFKGVWLCLKHELLAITASGGGAIVNNGSMASAVGGGVPLYVASKHAVLGLTRSAAFEYAQQGIRVNMIGPGMTTDTGVFKVLEDNQLTQYALPVIPMARGGKPSEIAGTVLFLCSDAASYITGQAIYIDGGFTMV